MVWNYRLIKNVIGGETRFDVYETYYLHDRINDDQIHAISLSPDIPLHGESVQDAFHILRMIMKDITTHPPLDMATIIFHSLPKEELIPEEQMFPEEQFSPFSPIPEGTQPVCGISKPIGEITHDNAQPAGVALPTITKIREFIRWRNKEYGSDWVLNRSKDSGWALTFDCLICKQVVPVVYYTMFSGGLKQLAEQLMILDNYHMIE